ncbi:predicted protein [Thalassiosira pseudonana CCMP1335]|uniref:Protein LTV1 homolog n=1 Tax=Thalassiosira pseudonana TaxID=35128 RepID=B8LDC4_THAPS|nr:predicted protein [Thalassiosira pseudonana CCMP1335]EED86782.1 predicted protein [Thalassiosira pseudonana CCMP1335]|eukprot:scaffold2151_cov178-Alexandrium_tamarense.AAC.2
MGKKKPFIDKKSASVFHVVRRSQRDVGVEATAETLSDFVLMPSPDNEKRAAAAASNTNATSATATTASKQHKKASVDFTALKSQLSAAGLLDQTATTYSKYTKPIQGGGTFISSSDATSSDNTYIPNNGNASYASTTTTADINQLLTDTSKNDLDVALQEAMAVREVGRMLDSIALTPDCMEEDVAHMLFDEYENGEYEEILDDFCLTANMEPESDDDEEGGGEFNFEEHIRRLMEKAKMKENGEEGGRQLEEDFFGDVKPLHQRVIEEDGEDNYDYDQYGEEEEDSLDREFNGEEDSLDREFNGEQSADGYSKPINGEQQRILCKKFEEALLEYDSDDVGDLDEECEDIVGERPLEGDAQLEAALNEFLTEKEDEVLIEGTKHLESYKRTGGSGYSALVGKTMVHASELNADDVDPSKNLLINIEESKKQMQKDLAEADEFLANPEVDLPPEEIFIDGKSYFTERTQNPWDCESILSTYSNLDNNPVVIGRSSRSKKKRGNKKSTMNDEESNVIPEDAPVKIQLSNKTGLPIGVFANHNNQHQPQDDDGEYDNYYNESDTFLSVNKGEARDKTESATEKKMRKMAIKDERKICRMQKKIMKEAFKYEFQQRGSADVVDAVGGTTVFRFS